MVYIQAFLPADGLIRTARSPGGNDANQLRPAAPICYALPKDFADPFFCPLVKQEGLAFQGSLGHATTKKIDQPI